MHFVSIYKATAFYCEFASVHLPFILHAAKSGRETSLGDNGGSGNQEQPWKGNKLGDKAAAAKSSPEGKWRQAWETRRQPQPRTAQKENHEGRQAWETRRQQGRSQEQPRKGSMKGDRLWVPRRQRQPRAAQKGNHEERQAWKTVAKSSPERKP